MSRDERTALLGFPATGNHGNVQHVDDADAEHGGKIGGGGTSMLSTATLIIANMLGAGVLGLPRAVRNMGWVAASVLLLAATFMSIYCGVLLGKLRGTHRKIKTYGHLAEHVTRKRSQGHQRFWPLFVSVVGYVYILGTLTIYLITMKISLMEMMQHCSKSSNGTTGGLDMDADHGFSLASNSVLEDAHLIGSKPSAAECGSNYCSSTHGVFDLPDVVWVLLVAALALPCAQIRNLEDAAFSSYVGVFTIVVVNVVILVRSLIEATRHSHHVETHAVGSSGLDVVNGLTQVSFAFGGHVLYTSIHSEMKNPHEFKTSVYISQATLAVNYLLVGFIGYWAYGEDVRSPITANLPDDWITDICNALLFVHVMMGYIINNAVITQAACVKLWPRLFDPHALRPEDRGRRVVRWLGMSTAVLILCILIAVLVPNFSDALDVIAGIGIYSLSFAVPVIFYLLAEPSSVDEPGDDGKAPAPRPWWSLHAHAFLVTAACVGFALAMWASFTTLTDHWRHCDYKIHF